jgi:hypothetical protein
MGVTPQVDSSNSNPTIEGRSGTGLSQKTLAVGVMNLTIVFQEVKG